MTRTSLNGWASIYKVDSSGNLVSNYSDPRLRAIAVPGAPGVVVRVRKECAPVIAAALTQVHQHVINLSASPRYTVGYNFRKARMASGDSNHASGTAVDMRYDVWTAAHKPFATADQIRAMHAILAHFVTSRGKRIFGWGGDWSAGYLDDMHLEIGQSWEPGVGSFVSVVDVQDVQRRLGIDNNGNIAKPVVVPVTPHRVLRIPPFPGTFHSGVRGPYVKAIQVGLRAHGYKVLADGYFGAQTKACVVDYQKRNKRLGTADGIVGPMTYKDLARPI